MIRSVAPSPLTPLEIASGIVVGADPGTPPLPAYPGQSPRAALEAAILPALIRTPCVVAFSGGRDSSAMLALAAHVARREGLPLPVPATIRFPGEESTREDEWQELVVAHLALDDWQRIDIDDGLDLIGPFARAALRRHGVLYPANGYTYAPIFDTAAGGTLVTGLDGDGLLATWQAETAAEVLAGRRRAQGRDILRLGLLTGPRALRAAVHQRRLRPTESWLTPHAEAQSRKLDAREMAEEPRHWGRWVDWWQQRRYLRLTCHFDDVLGRAADVAMAHPLIDTQFLSSLVQRSGRHGPGSRTTVMRTLFGDLLPDEVLTRVSKATFDASFFNRHSREFAARWDGSHVDRSLVDPDRLRAAWTSASPPNGSSLLLQATWLAAEG